MGESNLLKVPVIDHWWQTETGWCIAGNPVGLGMLPVKHGSPTVPMPGYRSTWSTRPKPRKLPAGKMGSIVIKLPLPPACLPTLWQQDERMREAYLNEFPGYYKTADAGFKDEDGYVYVMGRTDDIINVAGHRLSTGGMEEVWPRIPMSPNAPCSASRTHQGRSAVRLHRAEGRRDAPARRDRKGIVALVREKIGPVAAFKLAITVARLPKTRSGKILRGTIKKIADGDQWRCRRPSIGAALKGGPAVRE
jgi:propionyl-CoA synthetase